MSKVINMGVRIVKLGPITTNGSGAGTFETDDEIIGRLYAVQLVDGDLADGVDLTLTSENADLSIPLLTQANFNTDQMVYPRAAQALNTDGSALATHTEPLACGTIKAVLAQGGDTKTGSFICYFI